MYDIPFDVWNLILNKCDFEGVLGLVCSRKAFWQRFKNHQKIQDEKQIVSDKLIYKVHILNINPQEKIQTFDLHTTTSYKKQIISFKVSRLECSIGDIIDVEVTKKDIDYTKKLVDNVYISSLDPIYMGMRNNLIINHGESFILKFTNNHFVREDKMLILEYCYYISF